MTSQAKTLRNTRTPAPHAGEEDPIKGRIRKTNETRILAAAEKVFAHAGFGGATMAAIATASGLPKANLHYYFGSKDVLYRAVLARTLGDWLAPAQGITADADPRTALEQYIRVKMELSAQRPDGSKVFANEMLNGAPVVKAILTTELRPLVVEKAAVIQGWIDAGRMAPVDATHLFFTIWAATQTYADFDVQVCAVLGCKALSKKDYLRATEHVVSLLMRGCGL
jgi:TetR/AcrR family transcriptional regulator